MAPSVVQTDNPAFYDRHWQKTDTSMDPNIIMKSDLLISMVPDGVKTIVDVGCGDGFITHRLAERWEVTGVDRSAIAVSKLRCRAIEASADALPLKDRSVDLVHSSQMLEHLPDGVYEGAISEMNRVASRWLLLSVPFREQILRRVALCPKCGLEFNTDGHLRSFDETVIDKAFPDFERIRTEHVGPPEKPSYATLERARQKFAKRWYVWKGSKLQCPRCDETNFQVLPRNFLHKLVDQSIDRATTIANFVSRRKPEPYWFIALLKRRSA
jgi:ubiquinone/menaquinone biosynthesis C-methylase UbiE